MAGAPDDGVVAGEMLYSALMAREIVIVPWHRARAFTPAVTRE